VIVIQPRQQRQISRSSTRRMMVAIVDPVKQKIISKRPIIKPSAEINALERMHQAQDIQTLDRRANDFHSMRLGQVSKDIRRR
jgi:hypothetical protein